MVLQVKLRRHIASDNTRERIHRSMSSAWACGLGVESGAGSASCASPCAWYLFFCLWVTASNALCSGSLCCRANLSMLPIISPVHALMKRKLHKTALVAPSACAFRVALVFVFVFLCVPRQAAFLELRTSFFWERCSACLPSMFHFIVGKHCNSSSLKLSTVLRSRLCWLFRLEGKFSTAQLQCLGEKRRNMQQRENGRKNGRTDEDEEKEKEENGEEEEDDEGVEGRRRTEQGKGTGTKDAQPTQARIISIR